LRGSADEGVDEVVGDDAWEVEREEAAVFADAKSNPNRE
jgi:hypothetical protein